MRTISENEGLTGTVRVHPARQNAVVVESPPPVWIDVPGISGDDRDELAARCRQLQLPPETVSYWLLRYNGPRVIVHSDSIFLVCHAARVRERDLFFPYQVRMFARSDLVLTAHGTEHGKREPLQGLLPALKGAVDAGTPNFGSVLLRAITASYGQVLDRILDRAVPTLTSPGPAAPPGDLLPRRLALFLRRLHEQKSLLQLLRGPGSRFFAGGYALLDELTATLVAVEIGAAAVAEVHGHERRARKPTEVTDG